MGALDRSLLFAIRAYVKLKLPVPGAAIAYVLVILSIVSGGAGFAIAQGVALLLRVGRREAGVWMGAAAGGWILGGVASSLVDWMGKATLSLEIDLPTASRYVMGAAANGALFAAVLLPALLRLLRRPCTAARA